MEIVHQTRQRLRNKPRANPQNTAALKAAEVIQRQVEDVTRHGRGGLLITSPVCFGHGTQKCQGQMDVLGNKAAPRPGAHHGTGQFVQPATRLRLGPEGKK